MYQDFTDIIFYSEMYLDRFLPYAIYFVSIGFNSIVIKEIYNIIKSKIKNKENIPTE